MNTDRSASEEARLGALDAYRVLDTSPERGFDDIVTLATQLCDTPVALVSLVDRHRQWFKARVGFEPCETDLDSSVCRHALGMTDILEIEDLTLDPRTRNNPLVTGEPHLRFYAGAPLNTPDGLTLGTLCVIDKLPRPGGLAEAQRVGLRALANQVMSQLDLRRAVAEREADRQVALVEAARLEAMIATQQAVATAKADLGVVFQAIVDGALRIVDAAEGAVIEIRDGDGLVYDTVSGSSERHRGIRLPLTATLSGKAVRQERPLYCPDTRSDPEMDHALARELGIRSMVVVPVTRRGEPIGALKVQSARPDAFSPRDLVMTQMLAGLVASAFGDVAEVKSRRALRAAENRYRRTFESVTEFGVVVTDLDCTITEWNTGAERIFGWTADEIVGEHAGTFFTPEDRSAGRVKVEMRQALRDGQAVDERWHLRKDGSRLYASGNMMPLRDDDGTHLGFIKIVRDRTEQHLAGLELVKSQHDLVASEAKWRGLFENLHEGFILGRVIRDAAGRVTDWRYEEVNRAWGELVGIPSSRAAGRTIRELFPGIEDAWVMEFGAVVETGETIRFTRQVGALDRWYDGVCQPAGDDRFTVIFMEVTDRVLADRRREALRELSDALLVAGDAEAIPNVAAEVIGRALGVGRVGYGTVADDGETFTVPADWTADGYPSLAGTYRMSDYGGYAADLREGHTVAIPDIRLDPRTAADTGPLESVAVRSLVNHPVVERGRTAAILYVNDDEPRSWTAEEVAFVADAASRVRTALERRRAEEELREAQERLGLAVAATDIGTFDFDPRTNDLRWDERCRALFGLPAGAPVGYDTFLSGLHPADLDRVEAAVAWSLDPAGDGGYDVEYRTVGLRDGIERWVAAKGQTFFEDGRAIRFIGTVRDVTAAWDAAREIRDNEERFRLAAEVGDVGVFDLNLGTGALVWDDRVRAAFGVGAGRTIGRDEKLAAVHPDDRAAFEAMFAATMAGGKFDLQFRTVGIDDAVVRWVAVQGRIIGDGGSSRNFVGAVRDVTERVAAEERRKVLNAELAHRLKNTLALVQSIATQTLRTAPDMVGARKALTDRIGALAKAHDILLFGQRDAGDIGSIVRAAVALHDPGGRVRLDGPEVDLGPKAALTLSLIVHELATNAVKYGALSGDEGQVDVDWSVRKAPGDGRLDLTFEWREFGGPPVLPPTRKSFGTRLIGMGLSGTLGGSSELTYAPDGVRCRITASLAELQLADEPDAV
ncbi:PAS domain S-box protein [Aureimonas leprariae]|uniref:PAS domain S-box protein n=1 Tax=Plantimonas leprariae TaxID=2615207 RepID=UPI001386AD45|nr:PAS domain S-box protein [Aureimonas leprariae]